MAEKLMGRKFVYDAIHYLVCEWDKADANSRTSIISYIANQYKKEDGSVYKAIQNVIKHAWRITPPSDLEELYKAKVNYNTGIPTPSELIYHYAEEIKKELK